MGGLESDASGNNEAGVIELVESPRFALTTPGVVDLALCTLEKASSGAGRSQNLVSRVRLIPDSAGGRTSAILLHAFYLIRKCL